MTQTRKKSWQVKKHAKNLTLNIIFSFFKKYEIERKDNEKTFRSIEISSFRVAVQETVILSAP